jgi:hypothetical protein
MDIYVIRGVQPIHIIVNNGHVTLEGVVRNRNIAGIYANRVADVFSLTTNLNRSGSSLRKRPTLASSCRPR